MVTFVNEPGPGASLHAAETVLKPADWDRLKQLMERLRGGAGDILMIDDDPDVRARLRVVLSREGWTVSEEGNGPEALAVSAEGAPQLILLDLTMPVMDGSAFPHALRARPGCADILVVLTACDLNAAYWTARTRHRQGLDRPAQARGRVAGHGARERTSTGDRPCAFCWVKIRARIGISSSATSSPPAATWRSRQTGGQTWIGRAPTCRT